MKRLRFAIGLAIFNLTVICPALPAEEAQPLQPRQAVGSLEAATGEHEPPFASQDAVSPLPPAQPSFAVDRFLSDIPRGDGRRTLSAFPLNLARGVVGVISRDNLAPFAIGAGAAFAGHGVDARAASWIEGNCGSCGRTGASAGGLAVVPVVGVLFVAGRLSPQGTFRAASYDFAQAVAVNAVWTGALKYSLGRQRPDASDAQSLPSGHTSTAFSLATVAERHYGWKVGVPAYVLASSIGLSRIESKRHHLSDVVAGAALGVIVGRTVTRMNGGTFGRRSFSLAPATDPHGRGAGLQLSASW